MNAVARAQAGDSDAIRVLYLRYKDNVYGYVLSFVRDQHEAEDITQHVFLKLMSVIHKYRAREVPFTSWLLRVARNVALDHMRRRRTLPCEEVYETGHESDQTSDDLRRGLEQALQALPEDQRNVIVLTPPGRTDARRDRQPAWSAPSRRSTAFTIAPVRLSSRNCWHSSAGLPRASPERARCPAVARERRPGSLSASSIAS